MPYARLRAPEAFDDLFEWCSGGTLSLPVQLFF